MSGVVEGMSEERFRVLYESLEHAQEDAVTTDEGKRIEDIKRELNRARMDDSENL